MSSNSFFDSTDSTRSCLTNSATSLTRSNSKYKEYHFKPESNPDIKSKITYFWESIDQSNISVSESNFSTLSANTEENLKDFQDVEKREKIVKCKPIDNKWCHLLQLMSRRGLDKLALISTPKPCGFCENQSFSAKYADENCYDMVVDVSETKTKSENIVGEDEILELAVEENEEEHSVGYTRNYDYEIRRLIEDYEKMSKSIAIYHGEETEPGDVILAEDAVSLDSTNSIEDINIDEGDIDGEIKILRIHKKVIHETSNLNNGIIEFLRTGTERTKKLNKEETSVFENMVDKKYEEEINSDEESVRVIMKAAEKKNLKFRKVKRRLTAK